ncbi:MAG TPA: SMP-30/gluconolactonase/LRE family protein [Polyangiaceae bacterium]|nr:SMP-30/gluconolactonase/LRE family protein [Polyangiaceae bacterium]
MSELEPVANYHCKVGENPLWDEREGRLYWADIESNRLFRVDHANGEHECFFTGDSMIGGFSFQEDGSLLLFEADRISVLTKQGTHRVLAAGIDGDMWRFNDVIADPEGRVFAGTIGRTEQSGGLYRVDLDGKVTPVWKGTGCANGMSFTPDLSRLYWTCSTTRIIYIADYDRATGALENRRPFYQAPPEEGTPDGMTIDEAGELWSARWGGSCLLRIAPDATIKQKLEFPVTRVSSAAFGGPDLRTLYVTTAGGKVTDDALDGTLYRVEVPVPGRLEFRSRIRL